jgi:hypothetical protein
MLTQIDSYKKEVGGKTPNEIMVADAPDTELDFFVKFTGRRRELRARMRRVSEGTKGRS